MEMVVINIRLPRIMMVSLVGCALSIAGVSDQGVFQKKHVDSAIAAQREKSLCGFITKVLDPDENGVHPIYIHPAGAFNRAAMDVLDCKIPAIDAIKVCLDISLFNAVREHSNFRALVMYAVFGYRK